MSDNTDTSTDQNDQRDADQDDQNESAQKPDTTSSKDKTLAKVSEERRQARERAQKAETRLAELEAKQRDAEEAKAKEQGKYKELLEAREAELAELTRKLAERETTERKADIAKKHGIPDDLIALLQGETDDDIEASAKTIAKHLKTREAPETDAGETTPPSVKKKPGEADKKKFSDAAYWGLPQR